MFMSKLRPLIEGSHYVDRLSTESQYSLPSYKSDHLRAPNIINYLLLSINLKFSDNAFIIRFRKVLSKSFHFKIVWTRI